MRTVNHQCLTFIYIHVFIWHSLKTPAQDSPTCSVMHEGFFASPWRVDSCTHQEQRNERISVLD